MIGESKVNYESSSARNTRILLGALILLLGTWILYPIRNHTEAEDAYQFAFDLRERNPRELVELHPAHFLFHLTAKLIWSLSGKPDAYIFLNLLSVVGGVSAALIVGYILKRRFLLDSFTSVVGALLFMTLYNVWRYSHEAEVYAWAWAAELGALYLALGNRHLLVGGMLGGCFTGFHLMNALLAGPAAALALWTRDGFRPAFRYCLAVFAGIGLMVGTSYIMTMSSPRPVANHWQIPDSVNPASGNRPVSSLLSVVAPRGWVREISAFGSTILAGGWLFYDKEMASRLEEMFPEKNISEEIALGQVMPTFLFKVNLVTFVTAVLLFSMVSLLAVLPRGAMTDSAYSGYRARFLDWRLILLIVWLASYLVVQVAIAAAAPESWNPALPAAAMVLALGIGKASDWWRAGLGITILLVIFAHNLLGGIAPLYSEENDWNFRETAWLVEYGNSKDVVMTYNLGTVDRYLRWKSEIEQISLSQCGSEEQARQLFDVAKSYIRKSNGRLFALREVLSPPAYLSKSGHPSLDHLRDQWSADSVWKPVAGANPALYQWNPE